MNKIFKYMKPYKGMITYAMFLKFIGTVVDLVIPYILEHMIDYIVPKKSVKQLVIWGMIMLFSAFLARTLSVRANIRAVKVSRDCTYDIRNRLFWKSINLSGSQMDEIGLPSLTSRMTSDSYNIQSFVQSFQTLGIRAPILLIGGIAVTMTMDRGLSAILCVIAPIMIAIVIWVSLKGIPLYDMVQNSLDEIVRIMRENITGVRVVKALSKEKYEAKRFTQANEDMAGKDIKASIIMSLPGPIVTLFLNIGLTVVVILGAIRVNAGRTEPGVILAFLTYFNMILMGVMALNRVFMVMSKANASAERIDRVINIEDTLQAIPESEGMTTDKDGYIVFDHVSFSYSGESDTDNIKLGAKRKLALSNIDFSVKKGGSLGIIGATGCGKTTIANLLMRFYDATDGGVFIDGKDVRTYDKDELHRKFGVVFQNDVIIADTLKENISFGRDVSDEGIKRAAEDAQAKDFIEQYEDAYMHEAAIRGSNFSGGQKQRILISRALAAKPDILILDDSSSALDYRTDANLRKAIKENYKDITMIVVAQRISSIMSMDQIIVLQEGEILGIGKHEELMKNCDMYRDIYKTQMGEER